MFQYMSDDEVNLYMGILKKHFKGLFEATHLARMSKERVL